MNIYKNKYIKYKQKYIQLKQKAGSGQYEKVDPIGKKDSPSGDGKIPFPLDSPPKFL